MSIVNAVCYIVELNKGGGVCHVVDHCSRPESTSLDSPVSMPGTSAPQREKGNQEGAREKAPLLWLRRDECNAPFVNGKKSPVIPEAD